MLKPNLQVASLKVLLPTLLFLLPIAMSSQTTTQDALSTATPAYGGCTAPTSAGVHICAPFIYATATTIDSPFQLIAAGTGSSGPVRTMQVWIDGKKVSQVYGNLFDAPVTVAAGAHRLVVVEQDTTGAYRKSSPIYMTIQGSTAAETCAAPGTPGVNVCIPAEGSCHTAGWTTIVAAGTGASGTVSRMELWKGGTKLANFAGNRINTNLYLTDYSQITIIEVDSKGAYIKSVPITILSC